MTFFTTFPVSRQGMQDIAQWLIVGAVLFGVLALVARRRGGDPRRYLMSIGVLVGLTVVSYALAFTVAPNIPTPPVPFTARFQTNPVPDTNDNIDAGRQLFQMHCAICHGPRALGDGPQAFLLNPRPFNLQVHVPLHFEGEIYELYLRPEFQGLGFGRRLFTATRRDLAQSGLRSLVVWALSDNDPAVEFYRALGGRAVARSSERIGDKTLDKVAFAWHA